MRGYPFYYCHSLIDRLFNFVAPIYSLEYGLTYPKVNIVTVGGQLKILCYSYTVPRWYFSSSLYFNRSYHNNSNRISSEGNQRIKQHYIRSANYKDSGWYTCAGKYKNLTDFKAYSFVFVGSKTSLDYYFIQ